MPTPTPHLTTAPAYSEAATIDLAKSNGLSPPLVELRRLNRRLRAVAAADRIARPR